MNNKLRTNRSARRKAGGFAALELAAGSLIMIGVIAMALNVCFAMLSYGGNDRACRDAARAAAQGTTLTEATQLANAIITTYKSNNSILSQITVTNLDYKDFAGNPPSGVSPTVSVTTRATVNLPAPVEFFGQNIFGKSIPVQKTYTFPIVRLNVQT